MKLNKLEIYDDTELAANIDDEPWMPRRFTNQTGIVITYHIMEGTAENFLGLIEQRDVLSGFFNRMEVNSK